MIPKRRTTKQKPEQILTRQVAQWLRYQYPNVIYKFDLASDQYLSMAQAKRNSSLQGKWSKGSPDLTIFEMRAGHGALFLELKADGAKPYKIDGTLKKDKHLEQQQWFHEQLRSKGYRAEFSVGFDETIDKIRTYLKDTK